MSPSELPCLSLAIERLRASQAQHFAIHVIDAPYRGGYLLRDCLWTDELTHHWRSWQEMFSSRGVPDVPHVSQVMTPPVEVVEPSGQPISRSARLMQNLGIHLWQWLFDGVIQSSLNRSQGIAQGQGKALRLRLDVRDPDLISLPWETMQSDAGKQAISLSQQLLFSRTTSDVDSLPVLRSETSLNVLLVLGQDAAPDLPLIPEGKDDLKRLKLEQEAAALTRILTERQSLNRLAAPCFVDTLLQPTSGELIDRLESGYYNVLFYAGHGVPAADGGLLFLRPNQPMNGTELAQVLTRCRVKLAVFNACWGAQPEQQDRQTIPRSSLAEVLLHHGVPAVLAMRDSITDEEALGFIAAFAQALSERMPIDQAVAVARQHLLTIFRFNHQAWTLPVLYMHPEFNGELIKPIEEGMTQIPHTPSQLGAQHPVASVRSLENAKVWTIRGGLMRVGMSAENDLVLANEPGVSRKHAEIFYRSATQETMQPTYFLRDFSRYGTWVSTVNGWQKVHNYEVPLHSGAQIKFGGSQNSILEFLVSPAEGKL